MRQLKISKAITQRESASLDKYLQEISREGLITADDEVALAQRIKAGDARAVNELATANLRFVVSVAKQYQNQGLSLPDLINEGNLGLIKAAQRFDDTYGFKFISYAVWWIRQSILQALAEQSRIVRLPLNQIGAINKVNKTSQKLEQKIGREPTYEEIANELQLTEEKVKDAAWTPGRHISLDAPMLGAPEEEHSTLGSTLEDPNEDHPDKDLGKESLKKAVAEAINKVLNNDREKDVMRLFFGIGQKNPKTLAEIGEMFKITPERARQIKETGLRKLRRGSSLKYLRSQSS